MISNFVLESEFVHWCTKTKKWLAQICLEDKIKHLGYFKLKDDSAAAYEKTPVAALVQSVVIVKSQKMDRLTRKNLKEFIRDNVDNAYEIMTDVFKAYMSLRKEINHKFVNHSSGK